ncbi:hypothetical protein GNF10_32525 [Nostoc sp. UCD121]|uniref:hypothetical protein n=1 Tax=unclassified Nostoc TaxID=2593658 RepID=UPI001625772C|nr:MULTISPECIES: hypothetical protein [unclassified Nostoc]MBC1225405.1 hypothetical protein [Nostoc sp. UCD120]MBC1280540.1 hypothetical protein [Nostoc sp. UCD121]
MTKKISSAFGKGVLSPILLILVAGSLGLAVIDKENRPAYFDMVKVAVGYSFGAMTLQNGDSSNQDEEDSKEPDEEG